MIQSAAEIIKLDATIDSSASTLTGKWTYTALLRQTAPVKQEILPLF
jgi:hypothetical protein